MQGSHSSNDEESSLLRHYATPTGKQLWLSKEHATSIYRILQSTG